MFCFIQHTQLFSLLRSQMTAGFILMLYVLTSHFSNCLKSWVASARPPSIFFSSVFADFVYVNHLLRVIPVYFIGYPFPAASAKVSSTDSMDVCNVFQKIYTLCDSGYVKKHPPPQPFFSCASAFNVFSFAIITPSSEIVFVVIVSYSLLTSIAYCCRYVKAKSIAFW